MKKGYLTTYNNTTGYKGVVINSNKVHFYNWGEDGDKAGYITSLYNDTYDYTGIGIVCENYFRVSVAGSSKLDISEEDMILFHDSIYVNGDVCTFDGLGLRSVYERFAGLRMYAGTVTLNFYGSSQSTFASPVGSNVYGILVESLSGGVFVGNCSGITITIAHAGEYVYSNSTFTFRYVIFYA